MRGKPTYISLFSGAGIGCYGFKISGYECIATVELLSKRLKIQSFNNKCKYDSGYIAGDISDQEVTNKLYRELKLWGGNHDTKELDVLISTPPCQGMSVANHKKKDEKSRNSLVVKSIEITKKILPRFFIFENVRSFLTTVCTDIDGCDKPIAEAIKYNLDGHYNILSKTLNFKDYGSNSSRTRTLVIGVRKDLQNIYPCDFFPKKKNPKTLNKLISDLPSLKKMGETSEDIFHSFREYDTKMLPWIENLKEGQSAFDNDNPNRIPHKIVDGKIIHNMRKNGDKYARWHWNREGPCIHTRNDILSSQNTIHPKDNRVFSIRELMRMMSIPDSFRWSDIPNNTLNNLSVPEKRAFLKKEELNTRHCIGEAVPTGVFKNIALNIKNNCNQKVMSIPQVKQLIEAKKLYDTVKLVKFINKSYKDNSTENISIIAEHANSNRQDAAAYFTRKDIVCSVVKDLPEIKNKKKIRILEPSVGIGSFLPALFEKYSTKDEVIVDVCDIDDNSLKILDAILKNIKVPNNFKINMHHTDFLTWPCQMQYDIVVGNPPFKKLTNNKELLSHYKFCAYNTNTNNLFSFFVEKALRLGRFVSLIVPKSILSAPEFNKTRKLIAKYDLLKICDYGERGFNGVKIETISFLCSTASTSSDTIDIESYINHTIIKQRKRYILSNNFPCWLIYRNKDFDVTASKMNLDIFNSFRDRQITKSLTKAVNGKVRVLKSRNIGNNEIKDIDGYDCYIDNCHNFAVNKFYNETGVVMVPNLTYYPRAAFLPSNTITDGSVALLTLKNGSRQPTKKDLNYYSSGEFQKYYKIARNYGTRSLNIDSNSVFFFGLLRH